MFTLAKRLIVSALAPSLILLLAAAALAQSRVNGKIAFARGGQIHTMEADGSNITRLTFSGATDDQPTWSPDGTQLAFRSFRDGNARIYVMNSDGSNQHAITNAPQGDARPAWSPDGTRIAFVRAIGNAKIFTVNFDGSNLIQLTASGFSGDHPTWSPDSLEIAFETGINFDTEVAKMPSTAGTGPNGEFVTNLSHTTGTDFLPAWSSDNRIAFVTFRNGGPELFVMDSNGISQQRIGGSVDDQSTISWSPDSTKLAFDNHSGGPFNIYTINADGTNQTALTTDFANNQFPSWQPIRSVSAGDVIISEFRFRGPAGPADEFIELYNNTDSALVVYTTDNSAGWTLAALSADGASTFPVFTIPRGTVLPARTHYLAVNNSTGGYSLNSYAAGDRTYSLDIADNAGVALFKTATSANWTAANRLDAAGFTSATNNLYREGAGLTPIGISNAEFSFVRNLASGRPQDTGDNAADFIFVSTQAELYGSVQSKLGAPGPENLASPINRTGLLAPSLVDPAVSVNQAPNRVRKYCSDPTVEECNPQRSQFGTLVIRRTYTNNQNYPVTRMRFRVVDFTTYPVPVGTADLRAISSSDVIVTRSDGTSVLVRGTTLETPAAQSPLGGGLNASLALPVVTLATPLNPGESVSIQLVTGVQQSGSFRFFVTVDLVP